MGGWSEGGTSCFGCPNRYVGCHNNSCPVHVRRQARSAMRQAVRQKEIEFHGFLYGSYNRATHNGRTLMRQGRALCSR